MSRTARCLFAIGLCASLAAACGDDDGDDGNTGGTGGGSGGTAGTAGRGGSGGTAGTAGRGGTGGGGTGGSAGTAGAAGTAGSAGAAGAAGAAGTAGTGGDEPDAGPDAALSDAGGDSGLNGNCPNFATAAQGIEGGTGQTVVISRIEFDDGGALVTFRGVGDGDFDFGFRSLCRLGDVPEDTCGEFDEVIDTSVLLAADAEISVSVPDVDPAEGELAVTNNDADNLIVFAYVAWGDAANSDFEDAAATGGFWSAGDFVDIDANNTIYGNGDATAEGGYGVCTGDGDTLGG